MTGSRPVVFTVVGIAGYAVQMLALWLLVGQGRVPIVPATLLATEAAILHNFAWHVRWTWADRPAGWAASLGRLARFNISNGGISLAAGATVVPILVEGWGVHYLVANLVAVLACAVVNYVAGDRFVFTDSASVLSRCARRHQM